MICEECDREHGEVGEGPMDYDDIVQVTAWMADQGFDSRDVAYCVEKPWKFHHELAAAKADDAS